MEGHHIIFLIFTLVVPLSSATLAVDYCVADFNHPVGPTGYPCKDPASLTSDDFVFTGLRKASNVTAGVFKTTSVFAVDITFPALNGLGMSIGRLDLEVGGVVPIHSHRATEVILAAEGTIIAGFIDTNNTAFYKTLHKGDVMVFPPMLLHFQANIGKTPALAYVSLNSASPGFEITSFGLGANDIPTELIKKVTSLDTSQVKKLKKLFGGTN